MKETRYKNVFSAILLALLFLGLSVTSAYTTVTSSHATQLYKQGKVLTENTQTGKVAVDVIGIYPDVLAEVDGGSSVYLLAYALDADHFGYIGLEANPKDKVLNTLLSAGKDLSKHPKRIVADVILASQESAIQSYSEHMTSFFSEDEEMSRYFETHRYLSIKEITSDIWRGYGLALVMAVVALFTFYNAIRALRNNRAVYDTLYTTYPELVGHLDQLIQGASYHQEPFGLVIYKNHLLSYKKALSLVDLTTVESLYHEVVNHKRYFITVSRSSSLQIRQKDGKKITAAFKNIGKQTDDELQELFAYLNTHYPDILLGYQD